MNRIKLIWFETYLLKPVIRSMHASHMSNIISYSRKSNLETGMKEKLLAPDNVFVTDQEYLHLPVIKDISG